MMRTDKSRVAAVDCFVLPETYKHCVARTCNASPEEPTHINCKVTVHNITFSTLKELLVPCFKTTAYRI